MKVESTPLPEFRIDIDDLFAMNVFLPSRVEPHEVLEHWLTRSRKECTRFPLVA